MARIYMIRHGKPSATWGEADDPGLDETGHEQARAAADALLALPQRPSRVVSSPLRRCRETAEPFARALGVEIEIDPRVGEIPTPADIPDRAAWLANAFGGLWREIEGDIDYEDWRAGVASVVASYPDAAVFSHYVALNAAVSTALDDPQVMGFRPDHCSITVFEPDGGRLILIEKGREAATKVL